MNKATTLIALTVITLASCRGTESNRPPIHPNLNMDFQERFDPQEANPFFADNRSMRMPVPGTIARGRLRSDAAFYEGRTADGGFIIQTPVPITRELLERGRSRYDIFCTPCHGGAGDGEGLITAGNYGYTPAPTFHGERLRGEPDGYYYDVITYGVRTMPSYAHQIPPADRWAIVAYIRALQRSQYADPEDVPPSIRASVRAAGPTDDAADVGVAEDDADTGDGEDAGATNGDAQDTPSESTDTGPGADASGAENDPSNAATEGDE